jgi:hypothetical protein
MIANAACLNPVCNVRPRARLTAPALRESGLGLESPGDAQPHDENDLALGWLSSALL